MLLLTSTSDKLRIITGSALNTDTHGSYIDLASGSVTPGRENHQRATASTFDLVGVPAASTYRNVKAVAVYNRDATNVQTVTITHTDGTTEVDLVKASLLPGESLHYAESAGWFRVTGVGIQLASGAAQAAVDKQTFAANGTWTKPTGFTPSKVFVQVWGGGGGGGGGGSLATAVACPGGAGGGGGGYQWRLYDAADLGSSESVTVGLGGDAGSGGAAGAAGTDGGVGGDTVFRTITGFGGGGGKGGAVTNAPTNGGGGGGSTSAGATPTGGTPTGATNAVNWQGNSGTSSNVTTNVAEFGGAGGGGRAASSGVACPGGGSVLGGGGGGCGGGHTATPAVNAGSVGGQSGAYAQGSGGAKGTDGASPTNGSAGADGDSSKGGAGGGGGGTTVTASTAGKAGGVGGRGGGGGGGGGTGMNPGVGGAGGLGGTGYCIVTTW